MALYTKKLSPNPDAKYAVEISSEPSITGGQGRRREADIMELSINGRSIFLSTIVHFLDSNGERVNNEMNKPYIHTLYCDKQAPYVNPLTGARVDPEYDENGNISNGAVTRYVFLMTLLPFPTNNNFTLYIDAIEALELQFIHNADVTLKEFDK